MMPMVRMTGRGGASGQPRRARCESGCGPAWHCLWRCWAAAWLLVLELGAQAPPRQQDQVRLGSVGAIRPDRSRRVLAVEHLAELRAIMGGGMGHGVAS